MAYRNTPHMKTGITPAELLLGQKPKTLLDLVKPNIAERGRRKQSEQKQYHDNKPRICLQLRDWSSMDSTRFKNSAVLYRLLARCRTDVS